jgi:5-(carboxyamino)imidazole ribonucleotide synthase
MSCQAAVALDIEVHVLADRTDDPAARLAARAVYGEPSAAGLARLAEQATVVTFEHERADPGDIAALAAAGHAVRPGAQTMRAAVDKVVQRRSFAAAGLPVPAFTVVTDADGLSRFAGDHGWPLIAKLPTGGYDGRGVWTLASVEEGARLLDEVRRPLLVEPALALDAELAVIVCRRPGGESVTYPVVETVQRDGICHRVICPAPVDEDLAERAASLGRRVAEETGAVGLLAVELFVVRGELLVNEIAARPHNSGHLTIEGCATSQFENHLRAVLDLPLGSTALRAPLAMMANVLGPADLTDPRDRLPAALEVEGAHIHLYGKRPVAGRKLGHVTVLGDDPAVAEARLDRVIGLLASPAGDAAVLG